MKHHLSCLKGDTIKAIILVCLAVGVVGMSYGSLAMAYGFPVWVPFVLSITVLAGASEFMFIGIVASGGNPLAATLTGLRISRIAVHPARQRDRNGRGDRRGRGRGDAGQREHGQKPPEAGHGRSSPPAQLLQHRPQAVERLAIRTPLLG